MSFWNIYTLMLFAWLITALFIWPVLDIIWVKLGKIPPSSNCSLAEIKHIREKGFFFHYSAFKRYKKYKAAQKKSVWLLLDEYKRDISER